MERRPEQAKQEGIHAPIRSPPVNRRRVHVGARPLQIRLREGEAVAVFEGLNQRYRDAQDPPAADNHQEQKHNRERDPRHRARPGEEREKQERSEGRRQKRP